MIRRAGCGRGVLGVFAPFWGRRCNILAIAHQSSETRRVFIEKEGPEGFSVIHPSP